MRPTPQILYAWRSFAWRLFGAKVGRKVLIRPGVRVTFPWKVEIGDYCWIGDNATFYSIAKITIGEHSVISQDAYLCAGTHDHRDVTFPLRRVTGRYRIGMLDCRPSICRAGGFDWAWRGYWRVHCCSVGCPNGGNRSRLSGAPGRNPHYTVLRAGGAVCNGQGFGFTTPPDRSE